MSQGDRTSSIGPILLTFVAGVAVGAAIAALMTPKSGPELRGDLKDAAARAKEKAARLAKDASETLVDLKERSRLAAGDLKRGFKDSMAHLKQGTVRPEAEEPNGTTAGMGWDKSANG
jgi:gas vesicle protein